jgi:hypothetical protein
MARYGKKAEQKVERAMHERKRGTLRSGRSGKKVTSRKQAIAIGLSEARRAGGVPGRRKRFTEAQDVPQVSARVRRRNLPVVRLVIDERGLDLTGWGPTILSLPASSTSAEELMTRKILASATLVAVAVCAACSCGHSPLPNQRRRLPRKRWPQRSAGTSPHSLQELHGCHRAGEIGPMPLVSYQDARPGRKRSARRSAPARCHRGTPIRPMATSSTTVA